MKSVSGNRVERIFILPDIHTDDCDDRAIDLAAQLCEAYKPDHLLILGDVLDAWWATARFRREASKLHGAAQREIDKWQQKILPMFKAPKITIVPGNHDARPEELKNSIEEDHPELLNGKLLSLLDIKKILCPNGENYAAEGKVTFAQGEFTATHGFYLGPTAGKREMLRHGTSGISGHTHALSRTYQRDSRSLRVWVQLGCLCKNPPRYRTLNDPAPRPEWMHAVGTLEVIGNQFHVEDIPFTLKYRAMFNGRKYQA